MYEIDCEGCEVEIYRNFFMEGVEIDQILMEVHLSRNRFDRFEIMMEDLAKNGFVIFSKEPNISGSDGRYAEFSFLKFDPETFHRQ